jgi:hypothetical protein
MRLLKEPRNVDFSTKSEPWNEEDLMEFRVLMKQLKDKSEKQLKKKQVKKVMDKS